MILNCNKVNVAPKIFYFKLLLIFELLLIIKKIDIQLLIDI